MSIGKICLAASLSLGFATAGSAQDIRFKFNNPSFGGNAFNSSHLLGLAEIQQQFDPPTGGGAREPSSCVDCNWSGQSDYWGWTWDWGYRYGRWPAD